MSATLADIASRAGTSTASVSLYLNDRDTRRVSNAVKARIDEAVRELNYRPHFFARSLSRNTSHTVGIILPTLNPLFQNPYTNDILAGIQQAASEHGLNILFFSSRGETSEEVTRFQVGNSIGCDGYILFSTRFCRQEDIQANIEELSRTGQPFVTVNMPFYEGEINQVLIPGLEEAYGTKYLLENGHQDILLLAGRKNGINTRRIEESHRSYLEREGLSFDSEQVIYGNYEARSAWESFGAYLRRHSETTAVCCMSDMMALGVYRALQERGLQVGGDVSVIGRNNSGFSSYLNPPLTTVDLNMFAAGRQVQELLVEAIGSGIKGKKVYVDNRVVERSSVSAL